MFELQNWLLAQDQSIGSTVGGGVAGMITGATISTFVVWHLLTRTLPAKDEAIAKVIKAKDEAVQKIINDFRGDIREQRETHREEMKIFWAEAKDMHVVQHTDTQQLRRAVDKLSHVMNVQLEQSESSIEKGRDSIHGKGD